MQSTEPSASFFAPSGHAGPFESISDLFFSFLDILTFFSRRYEVSVDSICQQADCLLPHWLDKCRANTAFIARSLTILITFCSRYCDPLIDFLSHNCSTVASFVVYRYRNSYYNRYRNSSRERHRRSHHTTANRSTTLDLSTLILNCFMASIRFLLAMIRDPLLLCLTSAILFPLLHLAWAPFLEGLTLSIVTTLWRWRKPIWFLIWTLSLLSFAGHILVTTDRLHHSICNTRWLDCDLSVGPFFHLDWRNEQRPTPEAIKALHIVPVRHRWRGRLMAPPPERTVSWAYTPRHRAWSLLPLPVLRSGLDRSL